MYPRFNITATVTMFKENRKKNNIMLGKDVLGIYTPKAKINIKRNH